MDNEIIKAFENNLNIDLIDVIISNSTNKEKILKVKIRPIIIKEQIMFQASEYIGNKVFHKNYDKKKLLNQLPFWLDNLLKQIEIKTSSKNITILISKKGKVTSKTRQMMQKMDRKDLSHNREKSYILKEGTVIPFLVDLGVMTTNGTIVKTKYDKFRQINRFLEFIEDILPNLNKEKELTIIDFGCGKSYLTFAMYYYLKELKNYNINIIGLDLKEDVIETCTALKEKYGYDKLTFLKGDIASYEGVTEVDMVVTLHACDTATDHALYKAVNWGAKVILSVPCCQHELNNQIDCEALNPIFHYGLIKERTAALITDAIRANILESKGYKTQILEFIDMEHTPKNILIRAVKSNKKNELDATKNLNLMEFLSVNPTLYQLFLDDKE